MKNTILIKTLEEMRDKIYTKKGLAHILQTNLLIYSSNWDNNKKEIFKKYSNYIEKLQTQVVILGDAISLLNKTMNIEQKKEEEEYLKWLSTVKNEELPF